MTVPWPLGLKSVGQVPLFFLVDTPLRCQIRTSVVLYADVRAWTLDASCDVRSTTQLTAIKNTDCTAIIRDDIGHHDHDHECPKWSTVGFHRGWRAVCCSVDRPFPSSEVLYIQLTRAGIVARHYECNRSDGHSTSMSYCRAEMYAGRVVALLLTAESRWICRRDSGTDGCQTVTLRFPLDAAGVNRVKSK